MAWQRERGTNGKVGLQIVALFSFLSISLVFAQTLSGEVLSVKDGDSIVVLMQAGQQAEVRLEGIDAREHGQAFGDTSRQDLSDLLLGKQVNLQCNGQDRYGRWACKVALRNGEDVDLDQIQAGMAWHYKQFQKLQSAADRAAYGAAEDEARRALLSKAWHGAQQRRSEGSPCIRETDP